jgi:Ca2+-transporting ATPase
MTGSSLPDQATAWHTLTTDKVLLLLQSDRQSGLASADIGERQLHYGVNELEESGGRSSWDILLDQFSNIMLLMLIGVAVVSGILDLISLLQGKLQGEIPFKDTIAIGLIVVLNGILGYVQESRAEKALSALKKLASPRVRVIRDGSVLEISAKELVPGDIVQVEVGVQVPADGRVLEEVNLQVREAALTGEAHAVNKQVNVDLQEDTPLGDRVNLLFQGTEVVHGRGTMVVTRTGMQTELGRIATLIQSVETEPTPLQIRMGQLSQALVTGSLVLVALVVVSGLIAGGNLQELVEVSLSMAVAVVPEGLPAVITVALALGTQRMVRRRALIRKLPAVETLGSVTTICSDKTGTLTQNKMIAQAVSTVSFSLQVTGEGYEPIGKFYADSEVAPMEETELRPLIVAGAICNDAILQEKGQGSQREWVILGDPTEGALLPMAAKAGLVYTEWTTALPRVAEFPFSSERKRMSVICQVSDHGAIGDEAWLPGDMPYVLFSKGSPELLLERCTQVYIGDRSVPLQGEQRQYILEQNNQMAAKGLRVLGFAFRSLSALPAADGEQATEQSLVWLGLIGMMDAPRPEVQQAVDRCLMAGIRPVMITGDHQLTARAIAEKVGIAQPGTAILTGQQLEAMTPTELENHVENISVYARVAPEHKLRIVQALQRRNHIVAMTGDGVNDAPALKQADIGIAMGIAGTDVSKEASDMVLLDDNFATIVAATEEGRVVYSNIRRFIRYILGSNIGELLTIAAAPLLSIGDVPLTPLQILWMNLVTDGLPALALAVEPADPNVMKRPPHSPSESIFARGLGSYMVRIGIIFAILTILLMIWAHNYNKTLPPDREGMWKTMVFTTLCIAQMGHAIAIRSSSRLVIEMNPFSNPYVPASVIFTTLLQLALVYVPILRGFFGTHYLTLSELGICFGVSALVFVWIELEKLFVRLYSRKQPVNLS